MSSALVLDDYLIKINGTKLPNKFIRRGTFSAKFNPISAGTYQNANGDTVEKYFPHRKLVASFEVSPQREEDFRALIDYFSFSAGTKDVTVTCWVADENVYITQTCTVSGLQPMFEAFHTKHAAIYGGFKIQLTGRGGAAT